MRARLADTLPLPSLSSCAQRVCLGARHAIAARSGEMPRARVSASPLPLGCLASGLFANGRISYRRSATPPADFVLQYQEFLEHFRVTVGSRVWRAPAAESAGRPECRKGEEYSCEE